MAIFGDLLRKIDNTETRLRLFCNMLDLGRGNSWLKLIGAGKTAEVYEIQSDHEILPKLVVKTPPFSRLDAQANPSGFVVDDFDRGCFSILREMDALSRIGSCAFVNMAQFAKSVFGVPALIFRKRDVDLRQLIVSDTTLADQFVRLAVLHMIARGLVRAQEKGVLFHQDLKPENVLIDYVAGHFQIEGNFPALVVPRINDFEFTNRIVAGKLRGFRPYLPAEHYDKNKADVDAGSKYDIYSLAIIAHELLTLGFHPLPTEDPRGLHCSAYADGLTGAYRSEEKWKKWARRQADEKTLPAIVDRDLASVLSQALAPDFSSRPTAQEMADAFRYAMLRESPTTANMIQLTIDFIEESGETGSGAEARFPQQALQILAEAPDEPVSEHQ